MKRYYSHFTFIYPDIYLKNHIVEMDSNGRIVRCFPFEKEIERTEFYSGLLAFIPKDMELSEISIDFVKRDYSKSIICFCTNIRYKKIVISR